LTHRIVGVHFYVRQHNILRAQMADTDQQEIWAKLVSDEAFLDHIKKNSNNLRCIFGSERAGGALLAVRRSSVPEYSVSFHAYGSLQWLIPIHSL
jgi:hypothetical protein